MYYNEKKEYNYNLYCDIIKKHFKDDIRYKNIMKMVIDLEMNIKKSPATYNGNLYSSYEGGYLNHILNVYYNSVEYYNFLQNIDYEMKFTKNEYYFIVLFHDTGLLGYRKNRYFYKNPQEWHAANKGIHYVVNDSFIGLNPKYVANFIFQNYDIKLTENEYIAMMEYNSKFDISDTNINSSFDYSLLSILLNLKNISILQEKKLDIKPEKSDYKKTIEKVEEIKKEKKKESKKVNFEIKIGDK